MWEDIDKFSKTLREYIHKQDLEKSTFKSDSEIGESNSVRAYIRYNVENSVFMQNYIITCSI